MDLGGGRAQRRERGVQLRLVAGRAELLEAAELGLADLVVADGEDGHVLAALGAVALTPTMGWAPASMRAWVRAAASSMRSLGSPSSMARVMPPSSSISAMCARARAPSSR